jgi:hypothetical protein
MMGSAGVILRNRSTFSRRNVSATVAIFWSIDSPSGQEGPSLRLGGRQARQSLLAGPVVVDEPCLLEVVVAVLEQVAQHGDPGLQGRSMVGIASQDGV